MITTINIGTAVEMLVATTGNTSEGHEITLPIGTQGRVLAFDLYPEPQGLAVTVGIGDSIVNVFDQQDGPLDKHLRVIWDGTIGGIPLTHIR